jgi:hypothetical protein
MIFMSGIAVAIVAVLILALCKPKTFRVTRTAAIAASPDKIFAYVNDFHAWAKWSPFDKLDPNMQKMYSGTESGVGAIYDWSGNGKAGQGQMQIVAATEAKQIVIKLDILKPFEGHNTCEFDFLPSNDGVTEVTWSMFGPAPLITRVMQVFVSMDTMIGKDFADGLARMKAVAEGPDQG